MNGCIYRTKDGECDLYAEGGKFTAFCEMDGCKGRKMSNADRIRSMTDEELSVILAMQSEISTPWCTAKDVCPYIDQDPARCDLCALEWLKQEVTQNDS